MIARSYITGNLQAINKSYQRAASQRESLFFSKLAILELCGWIEESMDDVVLRCAMRHLTLPGNRTYCEKDFVQRTYGFEYHRNFRFMLVRLLGLVNVEYIEARVNQFLTTITGAVCLIVVYHAFKVALGVSAEIKKETKDASGEKITSILTPSGGHATITVTSLTPRFYRLQLYGAATMVLAICVLAAYPVWRMRREDKITVPGFMQFYKAWFNSKKFSAKERISVNLWLRNLGGEPVDNVFTVFIVNLAGPGANSHATDREVHAKLLKDALQSHSQMINDGKKGISVGKEQGVWVTMETPNPSDPPLTQEQVDELMQGRLRMYVYAWSRWKDAPHDLDFCEWLQPPLTNELNNDKLIWHVCAE
jgi:hypothetical protein